MVYDVPNNLRMFFCIKEFSGLAHTHTHTHTHTHMHARTNYTSQNN
jgi:hypothetical protein